MKNYILLKRSLAASLVLLLAGACGATFAAEPRAARPKSVNLRTANPNPGADNPKAGAPGANTTITIPDGYTFRVLMPKPGNIFRPPGNGVTPIPNATIFARNEWSDNGGKTWMGTEAMNTKNGPAGIPKNVVYMSKVTYRANPGFVFDKTITSGDIVVSDLVFFTRGSDVKVTVSNDARDLTIIITWPKTGDFTLPVASKEAMSRVRAFDDRLRKVSGVYANIAWVPQGWEVTRIPENATTTTTGTTTTTYVPEVRGAPITMRWHQLEPAPGDYQFDKMLKGHLELAEKEDIVCMVQVVVGPDAPKWIYDKGVPLVVCSRTTAADGGTLDETSKLNRVPYYFSPAYQELFFKLLDEFCKHINALPENLRDRIAFVYSCEGSTGDPHPYPSDPRDPQYQISNTDWKAFRIKVWEYYKARLPKSIPLVMNPKDDAQMLYYMQNFDIFAVKNGGELSHGYVAQQSRSAAVERDRLEAIAQSYGKPKLSRGEVSHFHIRGWTNANPPQGLYWTGLHAINGQLDIWNLPVRYILQPYPREKIYSLFNKYAGIHFADISPGAFCALRYTPDASDYVTFPKDKYGDGKTVERFNKIAAAFAKHGAVMEDPKSSINNTAHTLKAKGFNDVVWDIIPHNYSRYLTQLDPGKDDVPWWNIDEFLLGKARKDASIYSKFGRGFEAKSGKKQMRFKLDETFYTEITKPRNVTVTITYLDHGKGTWSLDYSSGSEKITNTGSNEWKEKKLNLAGVTLGGKLDGADFVLKHVSGDDTIFHMISMDR